MIQEIKGSDVTVGDRIRFRLNENTVEVLGTVTYNFDRDLVITTGGMEYSFDNIYSYEIDEFGPYHDVVAKEACPNFTYKFGESACNVFGRWQDQLNQLRNRVYRN